MNSAHRLFAAVAAIACATAPAAAQVFERPDIALLTNRVALGCAIEDEKVFAVTNITAAPIAAGTPIFIDILHFPNATHQELHYHGALLPVGGVFREGTFQATSCTSWIEVPLMMAPSVLVPAPPIGPPERPVVNGR